MLVKKGKSVLLHKSVHERQDRCALQCGYLLERCLREVCFAVRTLHFVSRLDREVCVRGAEVCFAQKCLREAR